MITNTAATPAGSSTCQCLERNGRIIGLPGDTEGEPPLLHLRRHATGGLFDRLTDHYQTAWDNAAPTLTAPSDLDPYFTDAPQSVENDEDFVPPNTAHEPTTVTRGVSDRPENNGVPVTSPDEPSTAPARRWPRRP